MSCCGQKRLALVHGRAAEPGWHAGGAAASMVAPTQAGPQGQGDVTLRYLGPGGFSSRSMRTGRAYGGSGRGARLSVDPRDAESLLLTRLFART